MDYSFLVIGYSYSIQIFQLQVRSSNAIDVRLPFFQQHQTLPQKSARVYLLTNSLKLSRIRTDLSESIDLDQESLIEKSVYQYDNNCCSRF